MVRDPDPPIAAAPDHALGQYRAWHAPDDAESALDLAWTSIARQGEPAPHRLLPHGEPSIALIRWRDENGEAAEIDLVICGPYYKGRHYTPSPREELIAWRMKPELAATLFGISPREFSEHQRISAPKRLQEACATTRSLGERGGARDILRALKNDLSRLVCSAAANMGPERLAAKWLRDSDGQIRLRDIAARLDVSERNLRRRFTDHVGCSPKTYARHLQITAAALAAEKTANPDWAEIAAGAGFHDQPHMINAFQSEIGMTPKAFHAERRALL